MATRKRKLPIEDRPFLGRVGAILSGEASRRIKHDAKILAPQYAQAPKRRRKLTKKRGTK